MGKLLILAGVVLIIFGVLVILQGGTPFLGRLPGDVRIERENFTFYFPLGSCLIISAAASLVFWLLRR